MALELDLKEGDRVFGREPQSGALFCVEAVAFLDDGGRRQVRLAFAGHGGRIAWWREAIAPPEVASQFPARRRHPQDRQWRPKPAEGDESRPPRKLFPDVPKEHEDAQRDPDR